MASIPLFIANSLACVGPKVPVYRVYQTVKIEGLAAGDKVTVELGHHDKLAETLLQVNSNGDHTLPAYELEEDLYAQAVLSGIAGSRVFVWLE